MAGRKTSAEKARDDADNAAADDMFGGAFGGLDEMEVPESAPVEEVVSEEEVTEPAPEEAPVEEETDTVEAG